MIGIRQVSVYSSLAALTLLAACSSINYNYDFDPATDFSGYKTYAWVQVSDTSSAQRFLNPLIERRIVAAAWRRRGSPRRRAHRTFW